MSPGFVLLVTGGVLSAAVALLHVAIVWYGAPAYRYFGAGERLATMSEGGSVWPAIVTLGIATTFAAFATYALAAAGLLPFPASPLGVAGIGAIYTGRGLALAPVAMMRRRASRFDVVSSVVSLAMGLLHLGAVFATAGWGAAT